MFSEGLWHPQQESNPYQQYRKLLFYPLNYGGMPRYFITIQQIKTDVFPAV